MRTVIVALVTALACGAVAGEPAPAFAQDGGVPGANTGGAGRAPSPTADPAAARAATLSATLAETRVEERLEGLRRRLGITPGQDEVGGLHAELEPTTFGRPLAPERVRKCFGCHSTLTSTEGSGRTRPIRIVKSASPRRAASTCSRPGP